LSLNFSNENQYHFTVEICRRVYTDELYCLTGVSSGGEKFELGRLATALMRLLVELDHATKKRQYNWYEHEYWRIHAPPKNQRMAAKHAEVSSVKQVEPPVEVSAPAACTPVTETNVIQIEFSPTAK